ncbi:type IV secretion system protein [Lysobacter sp. BMK333-48F3]|uniref:type IV secretion system protein n=1 Tax=Lysobacter sp. BMK333-48F3 TaxID=2867962 RepID=UPI001C8C1746|nr:type IV secretion system protein [Lysobacter sp. BMK333-48F3]MBX9400498.1 type IV secretion system protein [Lysobacter sp. BMK333-48F3]
MDWMQWDALAAGIGDFVFFRLIDEYFRAEIDRFGLQLMARAMAWASAVALSLVTLWILVAGYRIVTGRSRESMPALVADLSRIAVIVAVATGMSLSGVRLHEFLTVDLDREIHELFTGIEGRTAAQSIDENLAYAQVAMDAIDAVQVVEGDQALREEKARALLFAGFGAAGPAMTAAAMLLLYKFGIAVFIGLGPLFVLCLIFEQTRELFRRWLLYGIGTLFSMATLSVVTAMATKLMGKIAVAFWVSKLAGGLPGLDAEGMSTLALQQGGIGLILTVFIVVAPPASALFFNGTLGQFQAHSAFAGHPAGATHSGAAPMPAMPPATSATERAPAEPIRTSSPSSSRIAAGAP